LEPKGCRTAEVAGYGLPVASAALLVAVAVLSAHTPQTSPPQQAPVFRGRTTVVITHRLAVARRASRVLVMAGGRIVEDGAPDVLLAQASAFARLFAAEGTRATP